ncbi:MAG: FtsK/SpoIIIE domain-containing protein [Aeromicrobium sp.]|uniref:FtsK/SpoIIIE domain-containing protein n=1 Tax=Aeromicrobium sp. TaxID=1871063 RepID=UPI0039E5E4C7
MGRLEEARSRRVALEEQRRQADGAQRQAVASARSASGPAQAHVDRTLAAWQERRTAVLAERPVVEADGWESPRWDGWLPESFTPRFLRVGGVHDVQGEIAPALLPLVGSHRPIVLRSRGAEASEAAKELTRSIVARLALMLGASANYHLIDPHHEGRSFPLAANIPNVAPRTSDVHEDLEQLFADTARLTREHPDKSFEELPEELRAYERFNVVVAAEFPRQYNSRAVAAIHRAARNARAGVLLVVHHDLDADRPGEHDDLQLDDPVVLEVTGRSARTTWQGFPGTLVLDGAPPDHIVRPALERVVEAAPTEPVIPWDTVNERDPASWWTESSARLVEANIGVSTTGGPLAVRFGSDGSQAFAHAAQAGATGNGKSVTFHSFILSLVTRYSPDELHLYLVDGKVGAEFQMYTDLPHARVVSLNTAPELAVSVLGELVEELERRYALFQQDEDGKDRDPKIVGIDGYRERVGMLPRIIFVVDEYGVLFETGPESKAVEKLLRLATKGRAAGIHLYLASQGFQAPGLRHATSLFENIHTRIVLPVTDEVARSMQELGPDGRALVRSHGTRIGRVVVNSRAGADQDTDQDTDQDPANTPGKVALVTAELAADVLDDVERKAREEGFGERRPVVFRGKKSPRVRESPSFSNLAALTDRRPEALQDLARRSVRDGGLGQTDWLAADRPLPLLFGRELTVTGTVTVSPTRGPDENVVVIGANGEATVGMVASAVAGASLASAPGVLSLAVLSTPPRGGSWSGVLDERLPGLLARRGHALVGGDDPLAWVEEEIARRSEFGDEDRADLPPVVVVALDLDRKGAYLQVAGDYGLDPSGPGRRLASVLRSGPAVGVHTVLGFRSAGSFKSVLPERELDRFRHRVYLQVSEDDSFTLLGKSVGHKVQPDDAPIPVRAGYTDMRQGRASIFLPFTTSESDEEGEGGAPVLLADLADLFDRASGGV